MNKNIFLDNWQFSLQTKLKNPHKIQYNKWFSAIVPGTIYHNLLNHELIPDPFYADNELKLQWVSHSDWSYKTSFNINKEFKPDKPIYLVFEGLDSAAEVFLNDKKLGIVTDMFIKYEFNISGLVEKKNILEVRFTSPYKFAKPLEEKYGKLRVALNSERVYLRKAQYSFGWDWGPTFADMGIWKQVYLQQKEEFNITGFTFNTLSFNSSSAEAELKLNFNKELSEHNKIIASLSDGVKTTEFRIEHNNQSKLKAMLKINNPKLWWPNGEGEQNLYQLKITLYKDDLLQDQLTKNIGLRTIELQLKDNGKNTFRFIVNGRKIFAKGANWIPVDSFLTRPDVNKYRALLSLAKEANMNMIRIWGGGIYEQDFFYEICDQLGLLVWQDFMFACAAYPELPDFLENVKEEVRQNFYRIQSHPSIAIWCGNNENEWIWYQEQNKSFKKMPGYKIYHQIIPDILKEIDPHASYWPSTPFNAAEDEENIQDPNSELSGNRHQWDLWSRWKDYSAVRNDSSLFVTEFGFQGPANQSTFEKVIPSEQRNPQSYLFEFHNKQVEGNERQFKFLAGHLPINTGWKDFIYLAQLSQALALKTCVEQWRFNYPHTNGSIIWQLNDCWPVSSWALIDSDLKPKLSYYLVKQSFNHHIIKFNRDKNQILVYVLNSGSIFNGYIELTEIDLSSKKTSSVYNKMKIKSSSYKELVHTLSIPEEPGFHSSVYIASLYNEQDELIYDTAYTPGEWKYLKLPKVNIKSKQIKVKQNHFVSLESDAPAFFVTVYCDSLLMNQNAMALLPGKKVLLPVQASDAKKPNINIFTLNDYLE